jgi:hypothetical protein
MDVKTAKFSNRRIFLQNDFKNIKEIHLHLHIACFVQRGETEGTRKRQGSFLPRAMGN